MKGYNINCPLPHKDQILLGEDVSLEMAADIAAQMSADLWLYYDKHLGTYEKALYTLALGSEDIRQED